MAMYTYDFNEFFSFDVWMRRELSKHDIENMGCNALDDLRDSYRHEFENELDAGIIKEV